MDNISGFWELLDALKGDRRTKRTRATAIYSGTDSDGTPWVTFTGASKPTPVRGAVTSELSMGDAVEVEVVNGKASIVGNGTQPSVSAKMVTKMVADGTEDAISEVKEDAASASSEAQAATAIAEQAAANAQAAIDAADQHFFTDDNGVHVSTEPDEPAGTRNILINSLGVILRKASTILAQFTSGEVAFYDGLGSAASNIVALFGANGAQIGKASGARIEQDSTGTTIYDANDKKRQSTSASGTMFYDTDGTTERVAITPNSGSLPGGEIRFNQSDGGVITGYKTGTGSNSSSYLNVSSLDYSSDVTLSALNRSNKGSSGQFTGSGSIYLTSFDDNTLYRTVLNVEPGSMTVANSTSGGFVNSMRLDRSTGFRIVNEANNGNYVSIPVSLDYIAINRDGTYDVNIELEANATSGNRGLYDRNLNRWLVYLNSSDQLVLNAVNLDNAAANTVFAAPNGSAGSATMRALVAADIPDLSGTYLSKAYGTYYGLGSSLSLTTSMQKLSLSAFTGSGTSSSSNGIKIATAGVYLITGTCYCTTGFTTSDIFHLAIYKGSTSVLDTAQRMFSASPYQTVTAQVVVSCAANDVIYLYAQNQTGARGTVANRDNHGLSVVRIA